MSDQNPETREPERKSSKRTQRYQQQTQGVDEKRRMILKAGLGVGFLAATGGLGLKLFGRQESTPLPITSRSPETTPRAETNKPIQLDKDSREYYRRELDRLNKEAFANPSNFQELAPQIGKLAVAFFCSEMGYEPSWFDGKIWYMWSDKFIKTKEEESGCIKTNTKDDAFGFVLVEKDWLGINLSTHAYNTITKQPSQFAAISLFGSLIHEMHHLYSPLVDDPGERGVKIKGIGKLKPNPKESKKDLVCYGASRISLEEAIVEESTQRMVAKLGIGTSPMEYTHLVVGYRRVLDALFNGDNRPILRLHQQSKPNEIFELVGIRSGAKSKEDAKRMGEDYLTNALAY